MEDSLSLWFRFGKSQMTADGSLHLIFVNIATLDDQLVSDQDGRGRRQARLSILFGTIFF
jgi:hypothetical protein